MRSALAAGALSRARRGIYVLPELAAPMQLAALVGGTLSHQSAAREHGLALLFPPRHVHVTVPPGRHRAYPERVRLHRAPVDPADRGNAVTNPLRTVLDCAATLPFREALAIADSALREGLLGRSDLQQACTARCGPGSARQRRIALAADADAANPFESALRAVVLDAGLRGFVTQHPVPGTRYVVDLADPLRKAVLEADSFSHHGGRGDLARDCRRYDELVRRGWLVLRFAWEHVMFEPEWVASVVVDACRLH